MMLFNNIYAGKRVIVTGDTGFKGSYLAMWLAAMDARVLGIGLPMPGEFSHYGVLPSRAWRSVSCDICDREALNREFEAFRPEVVFHLAAQPLVRLSYEQPVLTFDTNVTGTLNVLEAIRRTPGVRAAVMITSDKCYENREDGIPCVESDPMGGFDPYSASKGCAELLISSYAGSFFASGETLVASARAGNVIGGGDWAADRLIPDLIKAAAAGTETVIRHPQAVRPWQHCFEPLSGYLLLGMRLLQGDRSCCGGWNFGPDDEDALCVAQVAEKLHGIWPQLKFRIEENKECVHEAALLRLNCSKSRERLQWRSIWNIDRALEYTVRWYQCFYDKGEVLSMQMLEEYISDASGKGSVWTS